MSSSMKSAVEKAYVAVRDRGMRTEPTRWQSTDVSKRPEATTYEVLNYTLQAPVETEDVAELAAVIEPNRPWADQHFLERVSGLPLNPGQEWAHWPWGNSANSFRSERVPVSSQNPTLATDQDRADRTVSGFSHTYMERLWPKFAGIQSVNVDHDLVAHKGIRYSYGDARDVVDHLAKHPDSRQAYLPIWFPEDTGKVDVRVPCTLGYHFIHRRGFLHCTYYIRSCDLYRHFRDDVYLTVRLQLWMLDQLRGCQANCDKTADQHAFWRRVKPGLLTMHVVSLHCFVNDALLLWPTWKPR